MQSVQGVPPEQLPGWQGSCSSGAQLWAVLCCRKQLVQHTAWRGTWVCPQVSTSRGSSKCLCPLAAQYHTGNQAAYNPLRKGRAPTVLGHEATQPPYAVSVT